MGKTSSFTGLLDRATSQLQLEPDWASILQICDSIRQQDVTPKFAVTAMKKKMFDKNPHVAKFSLTVLEACMKNCGSVFHDEIATKDFMEDMRTLSRNGAEVVKDKALALIQAWAHVFGSESKYRIVQDTYNLMKMEGCQFPASKESEAMFSADCAPAWAEGDTCHMCRAKFTTFLRQHHCRKCGQVFCKKCSSKESIIPQFGIEREVRVCDPCYLELNPKSKSDKSDKSSSDSDLPPEYLNSALSKESQAPPKRDEKQLKDQEEEELQLAMALSLSQEEAQKEKKPLARSWPSSSSSNDSSSTNSRVYSSAAYDDEVADSPEMDPDLARYLNRSYWENRKEQQPPGGYVPPSAPEQPISDSSPVPYSNHSEKTSKVKKQKKSNLKVKSQILDHSSDKYSEAEPMNEADQSAETMVNNFRSSLEMLSERMQSQSGKGKHIAMDATIQSLFQTVSAMHPQLLRLLEQQEAETGKYEALKERLGLVKEARATLEDAREQHREKVRQQELEQDMLRRMQIEQKLELMRQQKAEYIAYQQRLQVERQMALEQQHQQLRLQKYGQQQYPGQYPVADGSSPYSSMNYMPPVSVPQSDGSPYSSLNYMPPTSIQPGGVPGNVPTTIPGPTAPGDMANQQPYSPPVPQGYPGQGYPSVIENRRSPSPRMGQPPSSYQQPDYNQYKPEMTNSLQMMNGRHQPPDYPSQGPEQVPGTTYSHPGQQDTSQQNYSSQVPSIQPPQYSQAANQPTSHFDSSQGGYPPQEHLPQSRLPDQGPYGNQQQQQGDPSGFGLPPPHIKPQHQQQQQPPQSDQTGFSLPPHMQQQQQQLPPQHQPPLHQQLPQQQQHQHQQYQPSLNQQPQQQPPQQHQQPHQQSQQQLPQQLPHQQQQLPQQLPHQQQQLPQQQLPQQQLPQQQLPQQQLPQQQLPQQQLPQQPPQQQPPQQQMYEPQPQQYQMGSHYANPHQFQQQPQQQPNQYYQQQQQPSGPPPQRQLSDLELISFD